MSKKGTIKDMFPPDNNGGKHGSGKIDEKSTGKTYVFQTPNDVEAGSTLKPGTQVSFNAGNGNQATDISTKLEISEIS